MELEIEEIDLDWIDDIASSELVPEENTFIKFKFFFIDDKTIVRKYEQTYSLMTPNIITKEELIDIIKHNNSHSQQNSYAFLAIHYINFTETHETIKFILNNHYKVCIQPMKMIDDIYLKNTIPMFQDLNEVNFFFYKKNEQNINCKTKKIIIGNRSKTKRKY